MPGASAARRERPPRGGAAPGERGSSLVELVVLMAILGAAAAASIRSLEDGRGLPPRIAAERLARDLRYAQRLSMSRAGTCGVRVDAASESWRVFENGNPNDPVRDPATGFDHGVTLASGEFADVRIDAAVFGVGSTVTFDADGRPTSGGAVQISGGDGATTIVVSLLPETGLVRIAP